MKTTRAALLTVLMASLTVDGNAGGTQPAEVFIDLTVGYAQGDQVTARFSDNDIEVIGCGTRIFDVNGFAFEYAFCQARDADDVYVVCLTESPELVNAIRGISDFSFIMFSWQDNNGSLECTRIGSSTQSFYIPEFKLK